MTIDLGDGKSLTVNTFHGSVWITVTSNGGGTTVALPAKQGKEAGVEIFHAARKLERLRAT